MVDGDERQGSGEPQAPRTAKPGGFGAFAQQYRDRWTAGHPRARPAPAPLDGAGPPAADAARPAGGSAPTTDAARGAAPAAGAAS